MRTKIYLIISSTQHFRGKKLLKIQVAEEGSKTQQKVLKDANTFSSFPLIEFLKKIADTNKMYFA